MSNRTPTRALPERPDLDQLKRQAKELLAAVRAGRPDAVAEVAAHYRAADPRKLRLHEAQLVLARAYGFESWPKLAAFVNGATVERLIGAVRAGDAKRVGALLTARPELVNMSVSERDEHRALHHAVLARDAAMVRLLMARGADARKGIFPHRVPTTALAIATERGYDEIVAIIRDAEAARAQAKRSDEPRSPSDEDEELARALDRGDERALLASLERAVVNGDVETAKALLDRGADPNGFPDSGVTPMSRAYRARNLGMLELLTRAGGVVSASTAAYHNDVAAARLRIEEEDAGRLPPGAVTPGRTVAEDLLDGDCGEPEIVRLALARIDWPRDDSRWYRALRGALAFWSYVPWIYSPHWQPRRSGYLESFRLILARCHANVRGTFGRTILHDVMAMGFHDGASGWIGEDEALAFAVTLLDAGARTDVRDELLKSTPLGWACRWGRVPIVKELLRRGVDPLERDAEPWATPRAWAEKMGHDEIVELLDRA